MLAGRGHGGKGVKERGFVMGSWLQARYEQGWGLTTMDKVLTFKVRDFFIQYI
jgi:hypothetical protein